MEQSHGRPATQIEIEAFTAIANLQDENWELRLKIRELQDKIKQLEAENKDLSNQVDDLKLDIVFLNIKGED